MSHASASNGSPVMKTNIENAPCNRPLMVHDGARIKRVLIEHSETAAPSHKLNYFYHARDIGMESHVAN
jgi:hypothetical protein